MEKVGEIKKETRGRKGIDPLYKMKIHEIAIRYDLWGKPTQVLNLLKEWKKTRDKEIAQSNRETDVYGVWVMPDKPETLPALPALETVRKLLKSLESKPEVLQELPTLDTVQRLLKKLESKPYMHNPAQREYHYPTDNPYADFLDPSTPLTCLRFYQDKYDVRPSVGLVRWFCEMAAARQVNFAKLEEENREKISVGEMSADQAEQLMDATAFSVAVFAEVCWLAELIESLGEPKPDLTGLEMQLAYRSWEFETQDQTLDNPKWRAYTRACKKNGIATDAPIIEIPGKFWLLTLDMPGLSSYRRSVSLQKVASLKQIDPLIHLRS